MDEVVCNYWSYEGEQSYRTASLSSMQLVITSLLAAGLVAALPHGGGDAGPARAGAGSASRSRRSDDVVVIEAEEPRQGRVLISDTPVDNSGPGVASFKLPLPQLDDAVVIEAANDDDRAGRFLSETPRDLSFGVQAGPRLPLPDTFDDFVVIEAAGDDEGEGRALSDIPRDFSGPDQAGFKLPKPDLGSIVEVFDDFEIVEVGDEDEAGRSLSDIPTDNSSPSQAGFRLPISDDAVVLEVGNARQAQQQPISTRDRSDCFKPLKRSRCRALLSFWFFNNHSKSCQEYKFGGCDAEEHSNRFETEEECRLVCDSGRV